MTNIAIHGGASGRLSVLTRLQPNTTELKPSYCVRGWCRFMTLKGRVRQTLPVV